MTPKESYKITKFLRSQNPFQNNDCRGSKMSGAKFIDNTYKSYGITDAFFFEVILRLSLVGIKTLGIRRILIHLRKSCGLYGRRIYESESKTWDMYGRIDRSCELCIWTSRSIGNPLVCDGANSP